MNYSSLHIRPYSVEDMSDVIALWRKCGLVKPWNNPEKDIARKLKVNPEWFLVGLLGDMLAATVMLGYEGHRGWINYLAVHPDLQMNGIGAKMMSEVEKLMLSVGCPKINLQVRTNNQEVIAFYKAIGYSIDDVVSMGKRIIEDKTETNN